MKEGLRKLKGTSIATELGQITLDDTFREDDCEYDQLYFSTDRDSITVKVYDLQKEESALRFRQQMEAYAKQTYEEFADPLLIKEIQIKKNLFGIIALKICKGFSLKQTARTFSHHEWLSLIEFVVGFIDKLRQNKEVFLNFHPANISRNSFGEFKITDPEFLSNEGSFCQLSSVQQQLIDICQKQYLYRAPQLLDQYTKGKIDYKSDLYSFAIVLYEMLYHQYPFQSKLAQISCNYRPFPEQSFYSAFISKLLRPYHQRESLENLKIMIETQRKKVPKQTNIKSLNSGSTAQSKSGSIFSGLTQMFSKLTTETQSWYLNFTQNDDNIPEEKYLNLLVNKLYKKQAKLQKLHIVMLKYLDQGEIPQNQPRFIKTLLLMVQLFRRGPNFINYQWEELIQLIETKASSHPHILELANLFKAKLALNTKFKVLFRGNFYIEDLSRFKLVTVEVLESLQSYLSWVLESIKGKFLFMKKERAVIEYAKQLYCDEILDLISIITLSVICIRKDNELKLRKDPLDKIKQIEKKINIQLQKISYLSNHVNAHPIYSLQSEYLYYQEEFQIRDSPYYTTLEHFYKNVRQYKGLSVPHNYSLTYSSNQHKDFLSNENQRSEKSAQYTHKNYFIDDEEEYENENSSKVIESPSPQKAKLKQKFLQQLKQKPKRQIKPSKQINIFQLKTKTNSESKEQICKKIVKFEQFFKVQAKPTPLPQDQPQNQFFNFDKKDTSKPYRKIDDFSFFDHFVEDKNKKMKEIQTKDKKVEQSFNNFFENFAAVKEKQEKKKQKSALSSSSSQKIIQQSFLNGKGLQKSAFPIVSSPQKAKLKVDPQLLNNIISGLKLKDLKEMIMNNQQIIIDFKSLKLQKVIGSGSAGEVYVGKYNNQTLAIKKVKTKENPNALKEFERELVTYIKIKRHPYLVSLVGLSRSAQDYYLLTEFCNSGSLFDLLHKRANTVPLSWKQRINLATQVAKGMAALHDMKPSIIHRDLKSLNVFVIEENGVYTAKVADFGLSRSPQAEMMTMYLGTLHWMAPQLLDNKQYSSKVDVYSFAVVLWQICSRKTPYNELSSPMAIIKHVTIQNKRPNMSLIPPDCPPQLIEIMKSSWAYEPNDRPTFNTIIERLSKINMIF